jgi:hypothetical protein
LRGPAPSLPRALLIDGDAVQRENVARIVRPLVGELALADSHADAADRELVIAAYDGPAAAAGLLARYGGLTGRPRLVLLSDGRRREDYQSLFSTRRLTNLLVRDGESGEIDAGDLAVTVRQLLAPAWGLQRYFGGETPVTTTRISSSRERERVLGEAAACAGGSTSSGRLATHFCTVADELVTNALYNAPRDERGQSRFSHVSRSDEVALSPGEEVEIQLCGDGRRLGIAVSDPFGALTPEMLVDYLGKGFRGGPGLIENKPGGAGLGLFYIFDAVSHLVATIDRGRRTEMIGLIDVRGRYRDFAASNKSFNIFCG